VSSFIGIVNGDDELINKVRSYTGLERILKSGFCSLFSSSESDRLFYSVSEENNGAWIVSGIGINPYPDVRCLSKQEWSQLVSGGKESIQPLNGHFAGAIIKENSVELFTDQVGMRSLFILKKNRSTLFSTRLDWLLPFCSGELDWQKFGENWLCTNPFSGDCFITNIQRIHSSGWITINGNGISIKSKRWSAIDRKIDIKDYLRCFTTELYKKDQKISLGLSGGLDSRLLLAVLEENEEIEYDLYTFSGIGHPDEETARALNIHLQKPHLFLNHRKDNFDLDQLAETTTRSMLISSIPEMLQKHLYKELGRSQKITIDGAVGEIGRRRYLKSLEMKGKKDILSKNPARLIDYFYAPKADIFSEEISSEMLDGAVESLGNTLSTMPQPISGQIGDWLDLFSIRTRLVHLSGINQEMMDEALFHLMPFVQPDLLSGFLNLPVEERTNAKLFRSIIRTSSPELTKIPLVKGAESYPFWMNDLMATFWMKIKARTGKSYQDSLLTDILISQQEQIRDLFASRFVKESGIYDLSKIEQLLHSFYGLNNYTNATSINWMLCFELFRKRLTNESF